MIGYLVFNLLSGTDRTEISYTRFHAQLEQGNVREVTVQGETITGALEEPVTVERNGRSVEVTSFVTYTPAFGDDTLMPALREQGVEIHTRPRRDFSVLGLLLNFLPFLLLLWIMFMFFGRMGQRGQSLFSMGKSKAKLYKAEREKTTFDDIAGSGGVKTELREIIQFLREPQRYYRLGAETPRGVLLLGPPGTGKTLFARAVAGEADAPFFSITGSDFMEMFVGVGASRVRDMFAQAKRQKPAIIFIDELDSIGRTRGAGLGGGHDEREQTLNQLLSEMDGFEPNESVIVMAATNRPDILDPALLRPGRFDRRITIDLPSMKDRLEILKIHARNKPVHQSVDLERYARSTPGFSGADLANMLNEAALMAARKGKEVVEEEDLEAARDKIVMGLERENVALTEEECRLIAYHESGHAVVAVTVPHADPVHKVTIVPRGRAMGHTSQLPEEDRYIVTREYIVDRLAVMMGGRASEHLVLGTTTSGAENDLKEATKLARRMVLDWGMSTRLGQVALGGRRGHVFLGEEIAQGREYSESTTREVDEEVKAILGDAYERARSILEDGREGLDLIADTLMEREEITGGEVYKLLKEERGSSSST
jgi:cell division protease FtsH